MPEGFNPPGKQRSLEAILTGNADCVFLSHEDSCRVSVLSSVCHLLSE
jgi:hypothetical protein